MYYNNIIYYVNNICYIYTIISILNNISKKVYIE